MVRTAVHTQINCMLNQSGGLPYPCLQRENMLVKQELKEENNL